MADKSDETVIADAELDTMTHHYWRQSENDVIRLISAYRVLRDRQKDGGWVDVKERLPEAEKCVLAFRSSGVIEDGFLLLRGGWTDGYVRLGNVTHWRPLPAPPSAKEAP